MGGFKIREDYVEIESSDDRNTMWDDFKFGKPGIYSAYEEDFHVYTAGDFTITSTGSGSRAVTDGVGGLLLITTGGTNDNSEEFQLKSETFLPAAGKEIFYEARFKVEDADDCDFFMGLADTDTEVIDGVSDGIYFKSDDGDANVDFGTMNTSVGSLEGAVGTILDDTFIKVGFKVVGVSSVEAWINDSKVATLTTLIPTTELTVSFALQTGSANARTMTLDRINAFQEM